MSGLDVFGRLSPRMGARQAAEVVGAVLGRTSVFTKNLAGRHKTYSPGTAYTVHILVELAADYQSVQIGVPNIHTADVAGVKVAVAPTNAFPTTLTSALITPSGAWVDATFGGASSGTLTARIAAERARYTYTDSINVQPVPRSDGGARPLLMVRIEYPSSSVVSIPQNGKAGSPSWFNGGASNGHRLFSAIQAVLGVTTPAAFTSTASEDSNMVLPAIRYTTKVLGIQLLSAGDSTTEGVSAGTNLLNPVTKAALMKSSVDFPVEIFNAALHAQGPSVYRARLEDLLAEVRPTHVVYQPYSVNDVSVGGLTPAELSRVRFNTAEAIRALAGYSPSTRVLLLEGLPCNSAFRDTGAGDAARRAFNSTELPTYVSARVDVAAGYANAFSGAEDVDGQTTIAAGLSGDNVHPNGAGVDALYPYVGRWLDRA